MTDEPEVLIELRDGLGSITLNRPKAINALNHSMTLAITDALRSWAEDDAVRAVVVTGAGERGLCAGGDIVAIHADAKTGTAGADSPTGRFWRDEYLLNALIGNYPKPYVVIMDGIVMGGGVGLSAHGSHRIVTERSKIGMPEVGIGFVPDVGGTYLLSRAPGELGTHVALTTARMSAGDAIAAGFADYYVPSDAIPELLDALRTADVDEAVAKFAQAAPASDLLAQQSWIDACYSADTVEEIAARLQADSASKAADAAGDLLAKSPVSLKVTLRALRAARELPSLAAVLDQEYRVSIATLASHDLVEGIRAQVIDKDRNPQWRPATLAEVTDEQVAAYFTELGAKELGSTTPEVRR
ncbi:enoyl-CoA hydratase/isomerase family protein [Nocardia mangyaensis]|uniref:enoyl-CoA hydratase/isomerase family protein n=1 Tax=Nocardia mangyaensis TaxID=2213200 RepID=UPI002674D58C|nr:enoyl-CoA hydratase/isomerase family protein [Nocardia mangyaensis]MDO3649880.1 enoyl-CoA hydratase/isomerase family protein [Nocardia mangyaensis]